MGGGGRHSPPPHSNMKIRLLTGRASETESWAPGDVVDVPDDEALRLLEQGSAEPVAVKRSAEKETRTAT